MLCVRSAFRGQGVVVGWGGRFSATRYAPLVWRPAFMIDLAAPPKWRPCKIQFPPLSNIQIGD